MRGRGRRYFAKRSAHPEPLPGRTSAAVTVEGAREPQEYLGSVLRLNLEDYVEVDVAEWRSPYFGWWSTRVPTLVAQH